MLEASGLIFDMDGTLVDSAEDIASSVNHALKTLGYPEKSREDVKRFIGDGMRTLLARALGKDEEALISRAIEIFRPYYQEHCVDRTRLYPDVPEILEYFKEKPIALITNKPCAMAEKILEHFQIARHFKVILGAESTQEKKPHPEPVLKALAGMKVPSASALIIGDGPTDVQSGKAAGAKTCAVTYGYKSRRELEASSPDFYIDRLSDLRNIRWH